MSTKISPLAGKPAPTDRLVNVSKLVAAYYDQRPDPSVPAQRVAFGTSGHRGSSFDATFNEAHVLAMSQAICQYRREQGIDGPLFIGIDTHALSLPAFQSALEVLAANGVEVDSGGFSCDPSLQPRSQDRAGRRHRDHALAQPARGRRIQIQPA
jgi:phosphoglucomutase